MIQMNRQVEHEMSSDYQSKKLDCTQGPGSG